MQNNIQACVMPNLAFIKNGQAVTTTYAISQWANKVHQGIFRIVTHNIDTLKKFGAVSFENYQVKLKSGTKTFKIATLNYDQACFVICSMRNNEKTKQFKVELIKAFKQCREELAKQNQLLTDQEIENTGIDEFCRGYDAGYKKYADNMETAHELESDTGTVSLGLKRNSLVYEYIKLQKKIKANKAQWEQELKEFDSVINSAFELSEDLQALNK